jgi:hypothetical protein
MNDDLTELLRRFREDDLSPEAWLRLNELLARPEGRAALREDWFLEAALPQSLAAAAVAGAASFVRPARTSLAERFLAWIAGPQTGEPAFAVLQLWSRASFAALALGLVATAWAVWPAREAIDAVDSGSESDPAFIAQLILQNQLSEEP